MLPKKRKKCSHSAQKSRKCSRVLEMYSAPKSAEKVPSAIRTCLVSSSTTHLYPAFKNKNQTLGGWGRVCATEMNRSFGLVEFPKLQTGLFTGLPVAQPSQKLGSVFPSGTNRTLVCSARVQDISVCVQCVEQISGLQQSTFRGARSDSNLLAIYLRWKHTNKNIRM